MTSSFSHLAFAIKYVNSVQLVFWQLASLSVLIRAVQTLQLVHSTGATLLWFDTVPGEHESISYTKLLDL